MPARIPTSVLKKRRTVPAYGTYEQQPGSVTGHLPGLRQATQEEKAAFEALPESSWLNAKGDDVLYSALYPKSRLMGTTPMQGFYLSPQGLELNPGRSTGVLMVDNSTEMRPGKLSSLDYDAMNAAENIRAVIDAQNAGAAHAIFPGGVRQRSMFFPNDRPMTPDQMLAISKAGSKRGLSDVVDTGRGVTVTNFYPGAPSEARQARFSVPAAVQRATRRRIGKEKSQGTPSSIYADYTGAWQQPPGSGEVTKQMLGVINIRPEIRQALDASPEIGQVALNRLARDNQLSARYGITRQDLQNLRAIVGQGPGWVNRLDQAVKAGAFLPSVAAGVITMASGQSQPDEGY